MEKLGKTAEKTPEEEKEKMDKMFAKKQLGRPVGSWDSKREQYLKMLNDQKSAFLPKFQLHADCWHTCLHR